jgi:hypothetical protein
MAFSFWVHYYSAAVARLLLEKTAAIAVVMVKIMPAFAVCCEPFGALLSTIREVKLIFG